jgi:alpha-glucosidase
MESDHQSAVNASGHSGSGLRVESNTDSFSIYFNDRLIIRHTPDSPCLSSGQGEGKYRFLYGLFKISDHNVRSEPNIPFQSRETEGGGISISFDTGATLSCEVEENRLHIRVNCSSENKAVNRVWLRIHGHVGERIFGGGEQYSYLDLKGRKLPVWVQEPGLGRGHDLVTMRAELKSGYGGSWFSTYFAQPTFIFSDGAYLHLESSAYMEADFTRDGIYGIHVWEPDFSLVLDVQSEPIDLIESLTGYIGRQPALPDWAYDGLWLGTQGGREVTHSRMNKMQAAGVNIAALWCQDWEGKRETSFGKQLFWDWIYSGELYPDLPGYIADLKHKNVRFLGYINPFLAIEGELYKTASKNGYCVKDPSGRDYLVTITDFPAAMIDLTNPECRRWIKEIIKTNMIGIGLSGWMADFGEYIPADAVFHDGSDAELYHNRYAVEWAKTNREAVEEAGKNDEIIFFMRAGYSGSQRYASAFWNGDQLVNWSRHQGLPTVIPASLSLGLVGAGYVHSDLGGYTTIYHVKRSKRLIMRWAELSAFSQTMRSHEGNRPHIGWPLDGDEETMKHLARMTGIFTSLKPYHQALSDEYQKRGTPPMRHLWLHYPDDAQVYTRKLQYQYLYGPDLLVAPIYKRNGRTRRAYLPSDDWVHLWTGRRFERGWARVSAKPGEPAVFYRASSEWSEFMKNLAERWKSD